MIKFEHIKVSGWEAAIRGMRNPMNSWDKSDTTYGEYFGQDEDGDIVLLRYKKPEIGDNDLKLMKQLVEAGSDHGKFMRMINVTADITAPLYWWKEYDTYKIGTVANSCSTMHKIHSKELAIDDFSHEHLVGEAEKALKFIIGEINFARQALLETNDKEYWWEMIQLLPSSYNQKRTVQLNYEVLRNIYHSRKNHKLDEWRVGFMDWIKALPYSELITGEHVVQEN